MYWYDLITDGRASTAVLSIVEGATSAGHAETHELVLYDYDPDGWWENRYLELPIVDSSDCSSLSACDDRQKAGENTLFPCSSDYTAGFMTWTLLLYEDAGDVAVGCATWGQNAQSAEDCEVLDL